MDRVGISMLAVAALLFTSAPVAAQRADTEVTTPVPAVSKLSLKVGMGQGYAAATCTGHCSGDREPGTSLFLSATYRIAPALSIGIQSSRFLNYVDGNELSLSNHDIVAIYHQGNLYFTGGIGAISYVNNPCDLAGQPCTKGGVGMSLGLGVDRALELGGIPIGAYLIYGVQDYGDIRQSTGEMAFADTSINVISIGTSADLGPLFSKLLQ